MFLSLVYLLAAFIPVFFYICIIWATTPWKSINLKTAFRYLFTGLISIGIVLTYFRLFPHAQDMINTSDESIALIIFSFIQVALIEEVSKFSAFIIGQNIRKDNIEYDSPIGTMFYTGISALGFAFLENVNYAVQYGGSILIVRSVVSIMVHFLCGLLLGYWISASRLPSKLENRSLFEVIIHRRPILKKVIYYGIGLFCATMLHGLFDYNIFSGGTQATCYIIILFGIMSAYLAAKRLIEKSRL